LRWLRFECSFIVIHYQSLGGEDSIESETCQIDLSGGCWYILPAWDLDSFSWKSH
jgi:hypothetical protein